MSGTTPVQTFLADLEAALVSIAVEKSLEENHAPKTPMDCTTQAKLHDHNNNDHDNSPTGGASFVF